MDWQLGLRGLFEGGQKWNSIIKSHYPTLPANTTKEIVGTGAYFLNPSINLAEVAYMIVPEWQGSGLGAALQERLKEFAMDRGVRGFVAEFLQANMAMLNLAKRLGNIEIKTEDGAYHVTLLFA